MRDYVIYGSAESIEQLKKVFDEEFKRLIEMNKVKECINSKCNNKLYVNNNLLHLPLQCESCINKKEEK